ncbi:unnamed protein product [Symbiodinium sp. KB8]|nr:unnamed protein product [Symbiodinium sp. KB8]
MLQRWVVENWPSARLPDAAQPEVSTNCVVELTAMSSSSGLTVMLDTAFAVFAREPQALAVADSRGQEPLHVAARRKCPALVQLLLDLRACPHAAGSRDGRSALHLAAASSDVESVRRLLAARANPDCRDQLRMLPLDIAARLRAQDVQEVHAAWIELIEPDGLSYGPSGHHGRIANRDMLVRQELCHVLTGIMGRQLARATSQPVGPAHDTLEQAGISEMPAL